MTLNSGINEPLRLYYLVSILNQLGTVLQLHVLGSTFGKPRSRFDHWIEYIHICFFINKNCVGNLAKRDSKIFNSVFTKRKKKRENLIFNKIENVFGSAKHENGTQRRRYRRKRVMAHKT
jgi:hypothetical protein